MDYRQSGVDIDAGNEVVRRIKGLARGTFTPGVLSELGSFGGLFRLGERGHRDPVLVASADGVGTKLRVAFMSGIHGTFGQDLVNHCVNDILVQGARPLFFLDYFATGKLEPDVTASVVEGMARACTRSVVAFGCDTVRNSVPDRMAVVKAVDPYGNVMVTSDDVPALLREFRFTVFVET